MAQQANPFLRGRPVGIVKEAGRTCIIAASKEAKKYGIKTGCRLDEAKKLAPDIEIVPADFTMYLFATKQFMNLLTELAPQVEIFSLDEAFLDVSECQKLYPDLRKFGKQIQDGIQEVLGEFVTSNVGISYNRFLAKMAGETAPKGSITRITTKNLDHYLLNTDYEDVCGIGFRLAAKLRSYGLTNLYSLNLVPDDWLLEKFGKFYARELRKMSQGEEPHFLTLIDSNPHMKGVGRSITGWKLCDSEYSIKATLYNLAAEACHKARAMGLAGRYISVSLYGDQKRWSDFITLKHYVNHTDEMFDYIYNRMYKQWQRSFRIIKFAVYLGKLRPTSEISLQWFPTWQRKENIYAAIDAVSKKYGIHTSTPASMLKHKIIRPEVTGFLGDKQYQFKCKD